MCELSVTHQNTITIALIQAFVMTGSDGTTNGSHNVVAITKAGSLDLLPSVAGSPKTLPNEVLTMIFNPLGKDQLKAVRCVCRLFARLVSSLLFDEVYISPHEPNLDVFRQISEHQDLCRYPRTLIYDLQAFEHNIDLKEYYKELCYQLHIFLTPYPKSSIQHVDKDLEGLLRMTKVSSYSAKHNRDEYDSFSTCRVVQRGHELYLKRAEEQDHYNNGELLARLCIGLMRLTNVDKMMFQQKWSDLHLRSIKWSTNPRDLRLSSSPLARTWSPFHLQPGSSVIEKVLGTPSTVEQVLGTPSTVEFDNVISAFSLTRRPLRELNFIGFPCVPYEIFHSKSFLSRTFCQHSFPATYHLERLSLAIDRRHHSQSGSGDSILEDPEEKTLSVDLLAVALHNMPALRSLSLHGFPDNSAGTGLISMSELFQTYTLPALEVLDLGGMLGSAVYICAFLRNQPQLRKLKLRGIELSEGTWVSVVDDMRRWLLLDSVDLQVPLREDGGVDIWDSISWYRLDITAQIKEYVLNGGENPLRAPG